MNWQLHFLGVGDAHARALGASAAVLERNSKPFLLIDCGPGTLDRYLATYGAPPKALFITHAHLDHVGDLELLFARLWFDERLRAGTRIFLHAAVLPWLQGRVADYPGVVAEGGVNFWEPFQLIPCTRGFWLDDCWFDVFATRHHLPGTSHGLALEGCFTYTGDTRPIPEVLAVRAAHGELIAHDCGLAGNPSHTGIDDLVREYPEDLRARLLLYHYASALDGEAMAGHGYQVAQPMQRVALPPAGIPRADAG
ncbi:MAG: MBL fold metallo-hydrolase [Rhodanobacter sp.]